MFVPTNERYYVESYGNGWAYCVSDQTTGRSLWFQDHDADCIREQTNDFDNLDVLADYFDILEELK